MSKKAKSFNLLSLLPPLPSFRFAEAKPPEPITKQPPRVVGDVEEPISHELYKTWARLTALQSPLSAREKREIQREALVPTYPTKPSSSRPSDRMTSSMGLPKVKELARYSRNRGSKEPVPKEELISSVSYNRNSSYLEAIARRKKQIQKLPQSEFQNSSRIKVRDPTRPL